MQYILEIEHLLTDTSVYTFIVYCGSSIFIPSYEFMMRRYSVSLEVVQLTLAIYVVGCELLPLLTSGPPYVKVLIQNRRCRPFDLLAIE